MKNITFNAENLISTVEDTRDAIDRAKRSIAIEDIATVFVSEFVKLNKDRLQKEWNGAFWEFPESHHVPFLKMNYMRRRKLVEKVLDKIEKGAREKRT